MRCAPGTLLMQVAGPAVFLVAVIMQPAPAYEDNVENNGGKLLKSCEVALDYLDNEDAAGDIEAARYCDDYLTGFRENENVKEIHLQHYFRGYCFPDSGITNARLARVIVKYLHTNENEQHLAAYTAIRDALVEEFPCGDQGKGTGTIRD